MSTLSPKPSAVIIGIILTLLILLFLVLGGDGILLRALWMHPNATTYFVDRSLYVLFVVIVYVYSVTVEKQPLLVWKDKKYNFLEYVIHIILLTVAIVVAVTVANAFIYLVTHKKESSELVKKIVAFFRYNKVALVYTSLVAGVTEELIFRGYLQTRLEMLFKNPYVAIFLSSLIFGLAHYRYGTIRNVIDPFIIGLMLAIYYWKYRNIKVTITFHFLWDLIGLLVATSRP